MPSKLFTTVYVWCLIKHFTCQNLTACILMVHVHVYKSIILGMQWKFKDIGFIFHLLFYILYVLGLGAIWLPAMLCTPLVGHLNTIFVPGNGNFTNQKFKMWNVQEVTWYRWNSCKNNNPASRKSIEEKNHNTVYTLSTTTKIFLIYFPLACVTNSTGWQNFKIEVDF